MKLSKRKMRVKEIRKLRTLTENEKESWLQELYNRITENPEVILTKQEVDFIKNCINEVAGEDLDYHMVSSFICATRDTDFVRQCLENEKFEFEDYQKLDMLRGTNDVEYIKKAIEENKLPNNYIPALVRHLINLEKHTDYVQYIGNLIRTDKYPAKVKAELIESIKTYKEVSDVMYISYIEMCMEDSKCDLDSHSKADLILSMRDLETMKTKVRSTNGSFEYPLYESQLLNYLESERVGLDSFDKAVLIRGTNDVNFFNHCIFDKKMGLDSSDIAVIINAYKKIPEIDSERYLRILLSYLISPEVDINDFNRIMLINGLEEFPELKEANIETKEFGALSQYDCFVTTILKHHLDGKKEVDELERVELLKTISNEILLEFFIRSNVLSSEYTSEVILATGNKDFIIKCIENDKLHINADVRTRLVIGLEDKELLKQYIQREDFFDSDKKKDLILASKDEDYIKECIENKSLNLNPVDKAILIGNGIKDEAYKKACLHEKSLGLDIIAYDELIDKVGSDEEKEEWNDKFLRIKSLLDVSLEELEQTDKTIIELQDSVYPFYAKEDFIEIKKKVNDILEGVEIPQNGDEESELKAFLEITKRLANHISYNQYAVSRDGKKDYNIQRECRSLYGGIVKGESVCAGYANILQQTLACVGIEAKYINGYSKEENGHAWNQVKIGEKWYNVDLTWERNDIVRTGSISKEILKSDQEFEDHLIYSMNRTSSEEHCNNSMKPLENAQVRNKNDGDKKEQDEVDVGDEK